MSKTNLALCPACHSRAEEPIRITSGQYLIQCVDTDCGFMVNESSPERAVSAWNRRVETKK